MQAKSFKVNSKSKSGKSERKGRKAVSTWLTEEQKQRAAAEEQERHTSMLHVRLRDVINDEKKMYASTIAAVEARWIRFLRECKQKELVAEIVKIRWAFERAMEQKQSSIVSLEEQVQIAEKQYRTAFASHTGVLDSLTNTQMQHLTKMENTFEEDLVKLEAHYKQDKTILTDAHTTQITNLQLILDNLSAQAQSLNKNLQEHISEAHETAVERMEEAKKNMEACLMKMSELLRAEMESRYKEFMSTAQINMKDYTELAKNDEEITAHIAAQRKKIDAMQRKVAAWRTNLARNTQEWEKRNASLITERDATIQHLKRLKEKMHRWRQRQTRKLALLVKNAKESENALCTTSQKAERILRLVELCKPLETEREAILGPEAHLSTHEIEEEVRRRVAANEPGALEGEKENQYGAAAFAAASTTTASAEWQLLERFWTKHNKVVLDNAALAQERYYLENENAQLQTILKQYLDDISVNDSVMQNDNNLLQASTLPNVVQMASESGTRGKVDKIYNTVIEGNKFVNDAARQLRETIVDIQILCSAIT